FATFPLVLKNTGKSTITKLSISSTYPAIARGELLSMMKAISAGPDRKLIGFISDAQTIGNQSIHTLQFDEIHPGMTFGIDQPVPFHPTEDHVPIQVSDGVVDVAYTYFL